MKAIFTGVAAAGIVAVVMTATPVSAQDTNITPDDLHKAYATGYNEGYADHDDQDLAYEQGYLDGIQQTLDDQDTAVDDLFTICEEGRHGVVAEDMSCIDNPSTYYPPPDLSKLPDTGGPGDDALLPLDQQIYNEIVKVCEPTTLNVHDFPDVINALGESGWHTELNGSSMAVDPPKEGCHH